MRHVRRQSHQARCSLAVLLAVLLICGCQREDDAPAPPVEPPVVEPESEPEPEPAPLTYIDLVRAVYPAVTTTQPLGVPLDMIDAGRFVLDHPIYLCSRGDLWITHESGAPTEDAIDGATEHQTHVVRDRILFIQWFVNARGKWSPRLLVQNDDRVEWIDVRARSSLPEPRAYRWHRAQTWGDKVVVPTDRGISVFSFDPETRENHHALLPEQGQFAEPEFVFDPRGVLVWAPWTGEKPGSPGAVRFVDENWSSLDAKTGWPERIFHMVPLLDGSVLQLIRNETGGVDLVLSPLDARGLADDRQVRSLVEQLSDADPTKRDAAFRELTRYGTASWPILERLMDEQPAEAQLRIRQLLYSRISPTLGGYRPVDDRLHIVSRFADHGIALFAPEGVRLARDAIEQLVIAPAWLSIRPGRFIELLDNRLIEDAEPDRHRLAAFGNEWILIDPDHGPRRFMGNHFDSLLRNSEMEFQHVVGIDRRGRWLFRKSPDGAQTLVIDPTIPDPTPRLPVWVLDVPTGSVGWEQDDWPVIKRGGAWVLREEGWQTLNERTNAMFTDRQDTTTQTPSDSAPGEVLLVDEDQTRYFDGRENLIMVDSSGRQIIWSLPPDARGDGPVHLIRTDDATLFLFNTPGRVLRIQPTPDAPEPFAILAVHSHRVPDVKDFTRVWLDPAGRIIVAHGHTLAIMFPEGRIPSRLATLIPAAELEEQRR